MSHDQRSVLMGILELSLPLLIGGPLLGGLFAYNCHWLWEHLRRFKTLVFIRKTTLVLVTSSTSI